MCPALVPSFNTLMGCFCGEGHCRNFYLPAPPSDIEQVPRLVRRIVALPRLCRSLLMRS